MRERRLKSAFYGDMRLVGDVVLNAGAWIEIPDTVQRGRYRLVASHVEAGVEI